MFQKLIIFIAALGLGGFVYMVQFMEPGERPWDSREPVEVPDTVLDPEPAPPPAPPVEVVSVQPDPEPVVTPEPQPEPVPLTPEQIKRNIEEMRIRARMNAGHAGTGTPETPEALAPQITRQRDRGQDLNPANMTEAQRVIAEREGHYQISMVAKTRDIWYPEGSRRSAGATVLRYRGQYFCDIGNRTFWLKKDKGAHAGYRVVSCPF